MNLVLLRELFWILIYLCSKMYILNICISIQQFNTLNSLEWDIWLNTGFLTHWTWTQHIHTDRSKPGSVCDVVNTTEPLTKRIKYTTQFRINNKRRDETNKQKQFRLSHENWIAEFSRIAHMVVHLTASSDT